MSTRCLSAYSATVNTAKGYAVAQPHASKVGPDPRFGRTLPTCNIQT